MIIAAPPAAEVARALAGRSPAAAVLGDLSASTRGALPLMADLIDSPVGQSPIRPTFSVGTPKARQPPDPPPLYALGKQ